MSVTLTKGNSSGIYLTNYEELIRELNRVQPTLIKQLQKEYREIAKPVKLAVQNAIPLNPPTSGIHKKKPQNAISGFYPRVIPGRLSWGANAQNRAKPNRSVLIQTPSLAKAKRSIRYNKMSASSIARLKVDNAATVMADMAGSSGKFINKRTRTNEYKYSRSKSGVRRHKVNNQGRGMIRALHGKGSRFVWPAADKSIPLIRPKVRSSLQKSYDIINRRMAA